MSLANSTISADDLRAAIARSGVPAYVIGARARVNPIRLSKLLHRHLPLTEDLAVRILLAVQEEEAAR